MMSLIIFLLGLSQCFVLVISADWLEVQQGSSRKDYGTECDLQCGENAGCFCRDTGQTDGYGDGNRDGDVAGCGQGDTARDEGVAKCVCDDGYVGNGYNCTDINECDEGSHKCKHGACHNEIGTYTCTCKQGWVGEFCNEDIDECAEGTDNCHENANCYNSPGSYKCACKPGYLGDGKDKCNDIDECLCSSCHLNANCENTPGSYECKCKAGYVGDGRICDAICENCDPNASCVAGTCECNSGYFGSGTVCTISNNPVKRSIAANQRPYERRMYYKLDCVCRVCEKEELDVAGN